MLALFLAEEAQMRALRHLPAYIHWINLLLTRYNRALDHETAQTLTVREVRPTSSHYSLFLASLSRFPLLSLCVFYV